MEALIREIKIRYPDCAVTLSVGEQPRNVYESWFKAGADRYLLRHETADFEHYGKLHPKELTLENRLDCLKNLKEIGYQVGCGFMVGSPFQSAETLARDLELISEFRPHMVGVGPFIPQKDTPFGKYPAGSFRLTLFLLGVIRLLLPDVLLPATTALGSIHPNGRELGILSGANVCMPNLSPEAVRSKYALYDNKLSSGSEAAANVKQLAMTMSEIGYSVSLERGDHASINKFDI